MSPGSTEQEEEERDDLKPAKAVQRLKKNSLASQVFLKMSPFLRSLHILFAFEVCPKALAFCFEGHMYIVDRIPDAFVDNKGVCQLENAAVLNVELSSLTVQRFHSCPRSPASGLCCGSAFVPIQHPLVHPPYARPLLMTLRAQDHYLCLPYGLTLSRSR